MNWIDKMDTAIDYIEENILEEIDISIPAKIFYCSKYEFQRIFSFVADVPLFEYIQKRRLALAGNDIRDTNEKIIDIALKYGYESHSAFSRSFKKFHGAAPSEIRSNKNLPIKTYPRYSLFTKSEEEQNMKTTVKLQNINSKGLSVKVKVKLIHCREDDVPYIMGLKNFMDLEVQKFVHQCNYRDKIGYLFSKIEKGTDKILEYHSEEHIRKHFSSKSHEIIIAVNEDENEAMGFIYATHFGHHKKEIPGAKNKVYLHDMAVIKKYRRLGIGSLLLEAMKEYCIENGFEKIFAETRCNNIAVMNFFEKNGAEKASNYPIDIFRVLTSEDDGASIEREFFPDEYLQGIIEKGEIYRVCYRWQMRS